MASEQLALVIVAAIWAALNTIVSAYRVVNARRDIIITGVLEGEKLSLEHRRLLFRNDWLPLKFGVALASLLFTIVLLLVPQLTATQIASVRVVSYLAALGPLGSFIGFGILGLSDYRFIRRTLERAEAEGAAVRS